MTQQIVTLEDGNDITVSDIKGNPMWIPNKIIQLLTGAFIEDEFLRDEGPNINGLVAFRKSTPLFLDDEPEELVEFEEIPVANGRLGTPAIAVGVRKALGVRVSKDMIDENRLGAVQSQIDQVVNTFIRSRVRALRALLEDPNVPTIPAGAAWDTASGKPRRDIANAMEEIGTASVSGDVDNEDSFGFMPNALGLSTSLTPVLMDNDNFLDVYKGDIASEDIRYTGTLPKMIMGLVGHQSPYWPQDKVLVAAAKRVGFRSDSRTLQSTELYPEGNGPNGGPNEAYRSDTSAKRTMGVDQPLAACWITGVVTP